MSQFAVPGAQARTKWLVVPRPNPGARSRVFAFASAGHGPSMYRSWAPLLGPDVELAIVHLPGRESRWNEPPIDAFEGLLPQLADAIAAETTRPFAFFGHSLGGLVSFELTRTLRARGAALPRHLFASAHRAPQLPNRHPRISHLPDSQFVAEVDKRHGGVPPEVAANRELMELMLPSLKADYRLFEQYVHAEQPPLDVPITALGGTGDHYVQEPELAPWAAQTVAGFELSILPGGHFYLNEAEHRAALVARIAGTLAAGR